ncbi:maltokinase N-terminal cap-like domain-containing protein [Streptomyces hoynatensis]|uniref:1,4-alpha-glucan branching protein n=1 Tax=Streptomyces hoynatensis TaxID=1141874 RepID=A0A3A9Z634_9ACTN|nr:1,4-alpha-glucan branching protein [Streptomyces hoynatensis]RKN43841.1 1,4-alpha-glucan branching protein [Streptomyces hoynatensis]
MAVIHHTVLKPSKLELLTPWLPTRPWYRGGAQPPRLSKAGGFRLDDPEGEVGIEFLVVTDDSAPSATYLVPLTYRGAPLDEAEHALVGTMEHGVLGRRWAYDGCHDPVLTAQLLALVEGRAQAQDQNVSDTPDREITRSYAGEGRLAAGATRAADDSEGTVLGAAGGPVLRLHRVLRPAEDGAPRVPEGAMGHVAGGWNLPDGSRARGLFAVLHGAGSGPRLPRQP